jgi:hypothetical protein
MKNAEFTPAVETKTKGTDQVAVGCLGIALCLSKEFCSPGFGKCSLLKRLVKKKPVYNRSIRLTKFLVISSGVIPMPLSVTFIFSAVY